MISATAARSPATCSWPSASPLSSSAWPTEWSRIVSAEERRWRPHSYSKRVAALLFGLRPGTVALFVAAVIFGSGGFGMPGLMGAACGEHFGAKVAAAALGFVTIFVGVGQATGAVSERPAGGRDIVLRPAVPTRRGSILRERGGCLASSMAARREGKFVNSGAADRRDTREVTGGRDL